MSPRIKLKTKAELCALLMFLDIAESKIFKKEMVDMSKFDSKWGRYPWSAQVKGMIGQAPLANYDKTLSIIKDIRNWAKGLEQIKLVMPFQPSQEFVDEVYAAMEPSEPSGFILDLVVDKNVAPGGRLFHRGRYIDLTLKSRIGDLINKKDVFGKYL